MLTSARIESALKKLADSFLNESRKQQGASQLSGWGQFIGQPNRSQIGLYGTCAGLIVISLAYGANRVPDSLIRYLLSLWNERHRPGSSGARNFALTARLAFFLIAIRLSGHRDLKAADTEAEKEIRQRILADGLFVAWQIDENSKSATGNETATCLAVLAYSLTGTQNSLPPEITSAALALQARLGGTPSTNIGLRKFSLCAIALALDKKSLSSNVKKLISKSVITPDTRGQDTLDFWDYDYLDTSGPLSRRDYLHVPADAVDILLACTQLEDKARRRAALSLAEEAVSSFAEPNYYFGGRDKATSKSQAWVALAVQRSKALVQREEQKGFLARITNRGQ